MSEAFLPPSNLPDHEKRDWIHEQAFQGRISTEKAEELAAKCNLRPFKQEPVAAFDPMSAAVWQIPMVIAWIIWKDPQKVREYWPEYKKQCLVWMHHTHNLRNSESGAVEQISGWELRTPSPPSTASMVTELRLDADDSQKFENAPNRFRAAKDELWSVLFKDRLSATATDPRTGAPVTIPREEWPRLELIPSLSGGDELRLKNAPLVPRYASVHFDSFEIRKRWPASELVMVPVRARFSQADLNVWCQQFLEKCEREGNIPTLNDVVAEAKKHNSSFTRAPVRAAWAKVRPNKWATRGRRSKNK